MAVTFCGGCAATNKQTPATPAPTTQTTSVSIPADAGTNGAARISNGQMINDAQAAALLHESSTASGKSSYSARDPHREGHVRHTQVGDPIELAGWGTGRSHSRSAARPVDQQVHPVNYQAAWLANRSLPDRPGAMDTLDSTGQGKFFLAQNSIPAPPVPEIPDIGPLRKSHPASSATSVPAPTPAAPTGGASVVIQRQLGFPSAEALAADRVQLSRNQDLVSLTARDAPLGVVLGMIAEQHGLNIVSGESVDQRITVTLANIGLEEVLDAILAVNGYTWTRQNSIIVISAISKENKSSAAVQGRQVRVFNLNYVSAVEVDKVVKGLLSPVGQSFINETKLTDQRRTFEQVVVEDLPAYIERIAMYIAQVDVMPRQVLVEAHVLQVALKDNCKHGINFDALLKVNNSQVQWQTAGFASGVPPVSMLRINGTDLTSLVDLIKNTTDSKTLASPKVVVLNGQEARIQVGGQIGYLLTTTTQTSTLQSVDFLNIGVILNVTPIITEEGQVLMQVHPEVSTGRINPTTNLPESETTQVDTRVMLGDGEAIVIGGLIKENNTDTQNKIPWLGDLWLIGWFFQRGEIQRERNEIVIALVPRIIPAPPGCRDLCPPQTQQALTPLMTGPLIPVDRSAWEAQLPDASQRPAWTMRGWGESVSEESPPPAGALPASNSVPPRSDAQPNDLPRSSVPAEVLPTPAAQPPSPHPPYPQTNHPAATMLPGSTGTTANASLVVRKTTSAPTNALPPANPLFSAPR
ncbi:MAG: hypothetical protein SFX18_00330 [Pirellulales bacterium]|nr:hypothetical protein [Pirellulales bacterium]